MDCFETLDHPKKEEENKEKWRYVIEISLIYTYTVDLNIF